MVSGRYMGELFEMALAELLGAAGSAYGFTSVDLSRMLEDVSEDATSAATLVEVLTGQRLTAEDALRVRGLARAIVVRSARLIAATFVGTLWQVTGSGEIRAQHIAVDGSVYEKMPLVCEMMKEAFEELLGADAVKVDTILASGGSGLGAALAAAMAERG